MLIILDPVKIQQSNWIGRSHGAEVDFQHYSRAMTCVIYTTRPDTLFGATYMVISPEHPIIEKYEDDLHKLLTKYNLIRKLLLKNLILNVQKSIKIKLAYNYRVYVLSIQ